METYRPLIDGKPVDTSRAVTIRSPYDGSEVAEVRFGGPEELEAAMAAASRAFETTRTLPSHRRHDLLMEIAGRIRDRAEELAAAICAEAGKPIRFARAEAQRAATTFTFAAQEALRSQGETIRMDADPEGEGRFGMVRRFPAGPVAAISPFNFPLNLVAHKVAPALACGCTVVLKPASQTPVSALMLGRICVEAGCPDGSINVVPCGGAVAEAMASDPRIRVLSFTGSGEVGWALKARAARKQVTLELGGNAAAIVEADAPLEAAAERLAVGAFAYAGQVCISVQRIYVASSIYERFREVFVEAVRDKVPAGDPKDPEVICGPMIDEANADRIVSWIREAVEEGATLLCGGQREGNVISPAVLEGVDPSSKISCQEAFGPVVVLDRYDRFEDAIERVNDSDYGLQAGIFTNDLAKVMKAFEEIEVGGVIHNDYPTYRVDFMPYGGVKASGFGREGLRYAMAEMTEPRLLVLRPEV